MDGEAWRQRTVLMTADTVGGVWSHALELSRELGRRNVQVVLATMGAPLSEDQWAAARRVPGLEVRESRFRLEWMEDPWEDVAFAGEWLLSIEEEIKPDIVHLNSYCHAALPWRRRPLVVGHSCVLSWFESVRNQAAPASYQRYREEVRRGLRAAAWVVAPSQAMLRALQRHYGPMQRTSVIPNGRRPEDWPPGPKEDFILAAGRLWDEAKNVRTLERAAPRLPWPVYVAGEERHPEGGAWQGQHLRALGRLPTGELARWMGRASIFALPARYEPFGLSALEAALAGCALVLGDIPSLREVWGEAAVLVPPEDEEALARALTELAHQPHARERAAERARQRALHYGAELMGRAWMDLYAWLERLELWRLPNPGAAQ